MTSRTGPRGHPGAPSPATPAAPPAGAPAAPSQPRPCSLILGELPGLVAVNKPPGILTHPKKPGGSRTLWHLLRELLACDLAGGGSLSFINRLDRETSGVVLAAFCRPAASRLSAALAAGGIRKRYLCLAKGWPAQDSFDVDAPLARAAPLGLSRVAVRRAVHPTGRPALTRFRVLARWEHPLPPESAALWGGRFCLIEARPVTGRTHQIRAHLHDAGHPILGDKLYGPDERFYLEFIQTGWTPAMESALLLPRHALHCAEMEVSAGELSGCWRAPLPSDLAAWLPPGSEIS